MPAFDNIPHLKKCAFLAAFSECGSIKRSAKIAKIDRSTHYEWISAEGEAEDEYRAAFAEAKQRSIDALVDEARRRAQLGVKRAVYYKGAVVGHERHYDGTLLIFLLKGLAPETFGDKDRKGENQEAPPAIKDVIRDIRKLIDDENNQGADDDDEG